VSSRVPGIFLYNSCSGEAENASFSVVRVSQNDFRPRIRGEFSDILLFLFKAVEPPPRERQSPAGGTGIYSGGP
jgi:hypothetical protein